MTLEKAHNPSSSPWDTNTMTKQISIAISFLFLVVPGASAGDDSNLIHSKDGMVQINLPPGWRELTNVERKQDIQIQCVKTAAMSRVFSDPIENFKSNSMDDNAKAFVEAVVNGGDIENCTATGPKKLTVNGVKALQYEMRGRIKSQDVIYQITFVDSPTRLNGIMSFTTPSHWEEMQDDFRSIYGSFKLARPPSRK